MLVVLLVPVVLIATVGAFDSNAELDRDARVATANKNSRWPGKTIPYTIDSNFDSNMKAEIQKVMSSIQSRTCVKFLPRSGQKDYVHIKRVASGCYSHVGRIGGATSLSLSPACFSSNPNPMVAHELMHVMGFYHEHQRPDRNNHITINYQNIERPYMHQFNVRDGETFGLPYDKQSVMQYTAETWSKNGQPTMEAKDGGKLGPVNGQMSEGDFLKIKSMFKC